jgi:hypothetical protein
MNRDHIFIVAIVILWFIIGIGVGAILFSPTADIQESYSLALAGQYTVSNYSSSNDTFKVFLLSKEKLNGSIILENDNDITERLLVARMVVSDDW